MNQNRAIELIVTVFSVLLFLAGAVCLFGPEETATALALPTESAMILSLLGAAYLGMGGANWVARRSILGGIYGRAVIACNQIHFVVGAFALLGMARQGKEVTFIWGLIAVYLFGAAFFSYLVFYRPAASKAE